MKTLKLWLLELTKTLFNGHTYKQFEFEGDEIKRRRVSKLKFLDFIFLEGSKNMKKSPNNFDATKYVPM